MDSRENDDTGVCPREAVLEEYVLGRVVPAQADAVSAHTAGCSSCSLRCEELRKDMGALESLLSEARPLAEGGCPNDETIALFLDRGLDPPERGKAVAHMSRCRPCQARLAALYRELRIVGDPRQPLNLSAFLAPPEPSVLADRIEEAKAKSAEEASTKAESTPRQAPGSEEVSQEFPDEEERKRRYLSR